MNQTHKKLISELENDLEVKKSENVKNTQKARKLQNQLSKNMSEIGDHKQKVLLPSKLLNGNRSLEIHLKIFQSKEYEETAARLEAQIRKYQREIEEKEEESRKMNRLQKEIEGTGLQYYLSYFSANRT